MIKMKVILLNGSNEVSKKFQDADGLVVGTPVYYACANGSIISFLDRLFYLSVI